MTPHSSPTHSLADMQAKIEIGHYQITRSARDDAGELKFDEDDIQECVLALTSADFYKTMPSERVRGAYHDVYKKNFGGKSLYLKLTLGHARKTVVISFKTDEGADMPGGDHDQG